MSVVQEIHDACLIELVNFKMPNQLFLGTNKFEQLTCESCCAGNQIPTHFNSVVGSLKITILEDNSNALWVGENEILFMLVKLGVKY